MGLESAKGTIKMLRVSTQGWDALGSGADLLQVEAAVMIDGVPGKYFALELKGNDPKTSSHLAMLSVLRDAYINKLPVIIVYEGQPGKTNFHIKRIQME